MTEDFLKKNLKLLRKTSHKIYYIQLLKIIKIIITKVYVTINVHPNKCIYYIKLNKYFHESR